jgi:hypothetical protein
MTSSRDLLCVLVLLCLVSTTGYSDEQTEVLPAEEAARTMIVPEGFRVTLFAGEPDVQQPIGFCIDNRGRLWVAEAYNYPNHGTRPGDRILIFEDTDGDGKHDKRTVFYDQLNYVTGIEVGFGGAWVMSPPNFYFIPDRDADDRRMVLRLYCWMDSATMRTLITLPTVSRGDLTAGCMELMAEQTGPRSASRVPQQRNEFASTAAFIAIIRNDMSGSRLPTGQRTHGESTGTISARHLSATALTRTCIT